MTSADIQVKVCGITNQADAEAAAGFGADYLGVIFYPKSPRAVTMAEFRTFGKDLPTTVKRVYVQVRPEPEALREAAAEGFDFFQIHFGATEDRRLIESWSKAVSPEKLWLAPRIAPGEALPNDLLPLAATFLIDTYRKDHFGGTGETGDWWRFRGWREKHPGKRWVLAGGLNPENILPALAASGADFVDVNSGVEVTPGKKDHRKMREFFAALAKV